jgi:hypothetical protein
MNLDSAIEHLNEEGVQARIASQKGYADVFYNWAIRQTQWKMFLESLLNEPREIPVDDSAMFSYKVG